MRTVYLGTSDFAASVLRDLAATEHRPLLVITRPDRERGRGRKLQSPPVAELARELAIELAQPEDLHAPELLTQVERLEPDALCICAYGALIKEPLLSDYRLLNVHPSLLPRWRGAAPIERAIMAGDTETGVSIIHPIAELDAGPVYLQRSEPIDPSDSYGTLAARLMMLSGSLLIEALEGDHAPIEQADDGVTYAEKITAVDRDLTTERTAVELERTVRALTPHIGARYRLPDGSFLGIQEAVVSGDLVGKTGLGQANGRLFLGCGEGPALELLTVQPAGGRAMPAVEYLRGHEVPSF